MRDHPDSGISLAVNLYYCLYVFFAHHPPFFIKCMESIEIDHVVA